MKHLDLFSGIGGFALAARWMGWETVQFVEIDNYCQKVLTKNFPNIPIHGDIKTFDGTKFRGTVDIITGGFPCQPYSAAGKRKGTKDARHLWPEMLRVIGEVRPTFIVGENVYGLLSWSDGMVFEEVQADLENIGYEVTSFILPAAGVNAPHKRDRIWFIAHAKGHGDRGELYCMVAAYEGFRQSKEHRENNMQFRNDGPERTFTDTHAQRLPNWLQSGIRCNAKPYDPFPRRDPARIHPKNDWLQFPTQSGVCGRDDGIPNRVDRIKGLGNAVVPQVVYQIFKALNSVNSVNS